MSCNAASDDLKASTAYGSEFAGVAQSSRRCSEEDFFPRESATYRLDRRHIVTIGADDDGAIEFVQECIL
jgi:hypothetical protein